MIFSFAAFKAENPPGRPKMVNDDDFPKSFRLSLYFHLGLILAFIIRAVVFPSAVQIYAPALRVDVVGLPDLLKSEQKNLALPPAPAVIPTQKAEPAPEKDEPKPKPKTPPPVARKSVEKADPDEMVLKPKPQATKQAKLENRNRNALARLKSLNKITSEDKPRAAPIIKGNFISKGTSLSGDAKEAAEASYFDALREKLNANFGLPVWIARQNLSAQIQLFIDAHGRLHGFKFTKNSGNAQFDSAVKKTISDSQPFPAPPEGIASALLNDGIVVGFPL